MVDSEKENISETTKYPAPVILARGLISVTSVLKVDSKDAETIAMATIRSAHHPCIGIRLNTLKRRCEKSHIYSNTFMVFFIVDYNLILKIVITCFMCSMYINFDQKIQKIFCFFKYLQTAPPGQTFSIN